MLRLFARCGLAGDHLNSLRTDRVLFFVEHDDHCLIAFATGALAGHGRLSGGLRRFDLRVLDSPNFVVTLTAIGCCLRHSSSRVTRLSYGVCTTKKTSLFKYSAATQNCLDGGSIYQLEPSRTEAGKQLSGQVGSIEGMI
jgi:hypothetical protein